MHEWLSGGVSPCQGEGRGFESRLVLRTRALSVMTKPFLHYRKLISCNVKNAPRGCVLRRIRQMSQVEGI